MSDCPVRVEEWQRTDDAKAAFDAKLVEVLVCGVPCISDNKGFVDAVNRLAEEQGLPGRIVYVADVLAGSGDGPLS